MSIEDEIQTIDAMIKDMETYVVTGIWHPTKQVQIGKEITEVDKALNQLMVGHSTKADVLSEKQVKKVASLLKSFNEYKDRLPLPYRSG